MRADASRVADTYTFIARRCAAVLFGATLVVAGSISVFGWAGYRAIAWLIS